MAFYSMRRVAGALLYRYVLIKLLLDWEQLQLPSGVGRGLRSHQSLATLSFVLVTIHLIIYLSNFRFCCNSIIMQITINTYFTVRYNTGHGCFLKEWN